MPTYLAVAWHHQHPDEPVYLWHEMDDEGMETRKVEEFRDGVRLRADREHPDGETALSWEPMPSAEFIEAQDEFSVDPLDAAEFEHVWGSARYAR